MAYGQGIDDRAAHSAHCGSRGGFLCAAGGMGSYMSVMAYANSLMLDFRCVIIPRFVFATSDAFDGDNISDNKVVKRIEALADELVRFTKALRS